MLRYHLHMFIGVISPTSSLRESSDVFLIAHLHVQTPSSVMSYTQDEKWSPVQVVSIPQVQLRFENKSTE